MRIAPVARLDLDRDEIDHEAVGDGRGMRSSVIGRARASAATHGALVDPGSGSAGKPFGVPQCCARRDAVRSGIPVRAAGHFDVASCSFDFFRAAAPARRRPISRIACATLSAVCATASTTMAAKRFGVVARRDRPALEVSVSISVTTSMSSGLRPSCRRRSAPPPSRAPARSASSSSRTRHAAGRIDRHYRAGIGARFGVGPAALVRRLRQRHVGHVGAGRLDAGAEADAESLPARRASSRLRLRPS